MVAGVIRGFEMTTDKQRLILEAAAKACGFNLVEWKWYSSPVPCYVRMENGEPTAQRWNPLTSTADCAEMCAELKIDTTHWKPAVSCGHECIQHDEALKDHDNSRLKAWMYAATIVAAKIGGYSDANT